MHIGAHLVVNPLGGAAHGHFAQGGQIALAEKFIDGARGLLGDVDFALAQALEQLVGRQVDQFNFGGRVDDPVGNGFADEGAGNLGDHIVEAFEMLDVEGGVNVNPGGKQFFDILVAFGMARAGRVGVGQFIDQRQAWTARQDSVHIHFGQFDAVIFEAFARNRFQPDNEGLRFDALVRFDVADDHLQPFGGALVGGFEHGVGFPHPGGIAQENLQLPALAGAFIRLDVGEELVGIGSGGLGSHDDEW